MEKTYQFSDEICIYLHSTSKYLRELEYRSILNGLTAYSTTLAKTGEGIALYLLEKVEHLIKKILREKDKDSKELKFIREEYAILVTANKHTTEKEFLMLNKHLLEETISPQNMGIN